MADSDTAQQDRNGLAQDRTDWAEERTHWAEDRTLMANERTFAGWIRTGLAAVGIGLGFHAIFGKLEPAWLPRAIATAFILIGVVIFFLAQKNGRAAHERLSSHDAAPVKRMNMLLVALLMSAGSAALAVGVWLIETTD